MPDWEMWWWIKAMVQNNQLDDHTINMLVIILKKAMDEITTKIKENKMLETINSTNALNKQKEMQAQQDAENLAQLDSMLNDL